MKPQIINSLYRLFLAFNSTSFILVIFTIKIQFTKDFLPDGLRYLLYLFFLLIPIILTGISLFFTKRLITNIIEGVKDIEPANNSFLPSYLGYFFVSLSVPNVETLIFVFLLLLVFTYYSQTLYFNPIFLIYKYHFYYLTTDDMTKIFLISKSELQSPAGLKFSNLKRINNFTFIDTGDSHESVDCESSDPQSKTYI